MKEKEKKLIFYSCDGKYAEVQKYAEKKLFYIDFEEEEEKEQEKTREEDLHQEPTLEKKNEYDHIL